jgi:hypothetical protein
VWVGGGFVMKGYLSAIQNVILPDETVTPSYFYFITPGKSFRAPA